MIILYTQRGEDMKMRLLGVTKRREKYLAGYVEEDEFYSFFTIRYAEKTARFDPDRRFKKSDFRDYLHFAGVIGKYDMFGILTKDPVEIKELTLEEVERAVKGRPDLTVGTQIQNL
jgi:hypothetical protein